MARKKHLKRKGFLSVLTVGLAMVCSALSFGGYAEFAYAAGENSAELKMIDNLIEDIEIVGNYRLDRVLDVAYGKVYKLQQVYRGVDVYDSELSVAVDADGNLLSRNGALKSVKGLSKGGLSAEAAAELLKLQVGEMKIAEAQEVIFNSDNGYVFAYEFASDYQGGTKFIVSQTDGSVLANISMSEGAMSSMAQTDLFNETVNVPVDLVGGTYYLRDTDRNIYVYNGAENEAEYTSTNGTFSSDAVTAYNHTIKAYDFYTDANNIGSTLYGVDGDNIRLNVYVNDRVYAPGNTAAYINDYANQGYVQMRIESGAGNIKSLDVIAHEYQHGVTEYAANLKYEGDSGALDEAISDIFGALVEGNDPTDLSSKFWYMGDYASHGRSLISGTSGYVYNMSDKKVCKDHAKGKHPVDCDYNNVHDNSTIVTNMQYQLNKKSNYFTRERIGKLWYSTVCMLNSSTDFEDFANQFLQAAMNLRFDVEVVDLIAQTLKECEFLASVPDYSNGYHIVTIQTQDGDILATVGFMHGATVTEAILKKYMPDSVYTESMVWEFVRWGQDIDSIGSITADITLTAYYDWRERGYLVIFMDAENNAYYRTEVAYGANAAPPEIPPARESTTSYDYEFVGWDGDYSFVTEDKVIKPIYNEIRFYIITLMNNGEVYDQLRIREGNKVSLDVTPPARESTEKYTYNFIGWDKEITVADSDVVVNAKYEIKDRIYTVYYMVRGEVYRKIEYYYNDEILIPKLDYPGYIYDGWSLDEAAQVKFTGGVVNSDGIVLYAMMHKNNTPIIIMISVFGVVAIAGVTATVIILKKKRKEDVGFGRTRKY